MNLGGVSLGESVSSCSDLKIEAGFAAWGAGLRGVPACVGRRPVWGPGLLGVPACEGRTLCSLLLGLCGFLASRSRSGCAVPLPAAVLRGTWVLDINSHVGR